MDEAQDPNTLIELLKDKAKEIKQIKKKLSTCENKYVEVFKTNKMLLLDRQNLTKILIDCFDDPMLKEKLNIEEYGCYDYDSMMPIVTEFKSKEKEILKDNIRSELLPDMSKQTDIYKLEIESLTSQIETYTNEVQEYRKLIQQHDTKEAELRND